MMGRISKGPLTPSANRALNTLPRSKRHPRSQSHLRRASTRADESARRDRRPPAARSCESSSSSARVRLAQLRRQRRRAVPSRERLLRISRRNECASAAFRTSRTSARLRSRRPSREGPSVDTWPAECNLGPSTAHRTHRAIHSPCARCTKCLRPHRRSHAVRRRRRRTVFVRQLGGWQTSDAARPAIARPIPAPPIRRRASRARHRALARVCDAVDPPARRRRSASGSSREGSTRASGTGSSPTSCNEASRREDGGAPRRHGSHSGEHHEGTEAIVDRAALAG